MAQVLTQATVETNDNGTTACVVDIQRDTSVQPEIAPLPSQALTSTAIAGGPAPSTAPDIAPDEVFEDTSGRSSSQGPDTGSPDESMATDVLSTAGEPDGAAGLPALGPPAELLQDAASSDLSQTPNAQVDREQVTSPGPAPLPSSLDAGVTSPDEEISDINGVADPPEPFADAVYISAASPGSSDTGGDTEAIAQSGTTSVPVPCSCEH